ncbi:MAG: transposase, partial [Candidatus Paceibacterota bacterium]
ANKIEKYQRHNLVSIHAFCLMGNHMHLLLEQKIENGISRFMLKLGAGYASYFNSKYHRTGHLFQSRFKSV